ncbi:MAG: hypothetical protein U9N79_01155 [Actinomycetota bacterium]|nr:hypothetical protein [Actinomycetota bacterium]
MTDANDDSLVTKLDLGSKLESIASIVLAIAVVLTAWAAFQAGKWGGEQSIQFSVAGASRTESTRADTRGGQLAQIDVAMYIDFVTAFVDDVGSRRIPRYDGSTFTPTEGTLSGFLYERFREEFRPAMDAWLATDPVGNPDAPATPFDMTEYQVAEFAEAQRLVEIADEAAVDARTANQNGDNYVLTAVLFATVLFFSGIASKLESRWNRHFVNVVGFIGVVAGAIILMKLPVLL